MSDFGAPIPMLVKDADGTIRSVMSICSNADHVGNLIAEGDLDEDDRVPTLIRLYEGQLAALNLRFLHARERDLRAAEAEAYASHWVGRILDYEFGGD